MRSTGWRISREGPRPVACPPGAGFVVLGKGERKSLLAFARQLRGFPFARPPPTKTTFATCALFTPLDSEPLYAGRAASTDPPRVGPAYGLARWPDGPGPAALPCAIPRSVRSAPTPKARIDTLDSPAVR